MHILSLGLGMTTFSLLGGFCERVYSLPYFPLPVCMAGRRCSMACPRPSMFELVPVFTLHPGLMILFPFDTVYDLQPGV
jgi:hypothetical protein